MKEYRACAEAAVSIDYGDILSVRQYNALSDRMQAIVVEISSFGRSAVQEFSSILDIEPAAGWAAHQLVELAELNSATRARCFAVVEHMKERAERSGRRTEAKGQEMWLAKWKAKWA